MEGFAAVLAVSKELFLPVVEVPSRNIKMTAYLSDLLIQGHRILDDFFLKFCAVTLILLFHYWS